MASAGVAAERARARERACVESWWAVSAWDESCWSSPLMKDWNCARAALADDKVAMPRCRWAASAAVAPD